MTDSNEIHPRLHEARYLAKLGFIYQRKRERFFDLADKITKSLTVLLGGSLLAASLNDWVPWIGATVSAIGLLSLIFGYADKKQKHKELAEAYADILATIEVDIADDRKIAFWHGELQRLNAKEPPTLGTLVVICQNEIARAEGHLDHIVSIPLPKRILANWLDFHNAV